MTARDLLPFLAEAMREAEQLHADLENLTGLDEEGQADLARLDALIANLARAGELPAKTLADTLCLGLGAGRIVAEIVRRSAERQAREKVLSN